MQNNDQQVLKTQTPRSLWAAFMVTSLSLGVLTWLVLGGQTQSFDDAVLLWINSNAGQLTDDLFVILTELGGTIVLTVASLLLAGLLLWRKKYLKTAFVVATIGGSALLNFILKGVFERTRPDLWERIVEVSNYSYPSGHAISSSVFTLTIIVLLWNTKWRPLSIIVGAIYVVVIGFSRLYLGVHFPTDVLGGWLLGAAWVLLMGALFTQHRQRTLKRSA